MQAHQSPIQQLQKRILSLFLDADGCLYHRDYLLSVLALVAKHWRFFLGAERTMMDEQQLQAKLEQIKAEAREGYVADIVPENIPKLREALLIAAKAYKNLAVGVEEDSHIRVLVNDCIKAIYRVDPDVMGELVVAHNPAFIAKVLSRESEFDEFQLMIFSQRQSNIANTYCSEYNLTGCFYHDISFLERFLRKELPNKTVVLEKIVMADIKFNLPPGTTFDKILQSKLRDGVFEPLEHDHDENKFSISYLLHYVLKKNKKALVTVDINDDRDTILDALRDIYDSYPKLMASNTLLNFCSYSGGLYHSISSVQGTGDVDDNVEDNLPMLLNKYFHAPVVLKLIGLKESDDSDESTDSKTSKALKASKASKASKVKFIPHDMGCLLDVPDFLRRRYPASPQQPSYTGDANLLFAQRQSLQTRVTGLIGHQRRHSM